MSALPANESKKNKLTSKDRKFNHPSQEMFILKKHLIWKNAAEKRLQPSTSEWNRKWY